MRGGVGLISRRVQEIPLRELASIKVENGASFIYRENYSRYIGVLLSAPVGGIVALWITHTPFSVSSGIGFLALFGVSVQTAVVYISYVNELRLSGMPIDEAIREGAVLRLRPIMMTALVAALGLLPAAIAVGVGTDTQRRCSY